MAPIGARAPRQATLLLALALAAFGRAAAFMAAPGPVGSMLRGTQLRSAVSPPLAGALAVVNPFGSAFRAGVTQGITRLRASEEEGDVHDMNVPQDTDGEPAEGFTRVYLEVEVKTKWGDQVHAAGSTGKLGSWKPLEGVALRTDKLNYPRWNALRDLPTGEMFEYKYVIVRNGGEKHDWEDGIQNRALTPEGMCTIVNDNKFNEARTSEPFIEERAQVREPGFFGRLLGQGSKKK